MDYRELDIGTDGGNLRVLSWGNSPNVVVALHGITGSGMAWNAVAERLPADWTLAAPDLRGRGHSNELPGPYGLDQHVTDVAAVLRHFTREQAPVLAGHSMGAFVALLAKDAHPSLSGRLMLLDGGLPLPVAPAPADVYAALDASLAPAIARLTRIFRDEADYLDFFRAYPAFAGRWCPALERHFRYDLEPAADGAGLRSRVRQDAVRADSRELLLGGMRFAAALERLTEPTPLITVPNGVSGEPPGMQPPPLVRDWQAHAPYLRPRLLPDVNHYTMLFDPLATTAIAETITGAPAT
jgi:pimeloyl-ACP methyl ester carboxylesterase